MSPSFRRALVFGAIMGLTLLTGWLIFARQSQRMSKLIQIGADGSLPVRKF